MVKLTQFIVLVLFACSATAQVVDPTDYPIDYNFDEEAPLPTKVLIDWIGNLNGPPEPSYDCYFGHVSYRSRAKCSEQYPLLRTLKCESSAYNVDPEGPEAGLGLSQSGQFPFNVYIEARGPFQIAFKIDTPHLCGWPSEFVIDLTKPCSTGTSADQELVYVYDTRGEDISCNSGISGFVPDDANVPEDSHIRIEVFYNNLWNIKVDNSDLTKPVELTEEEQPESTQEVIDEIKQRNDTYLTSMEQILSTLDEGLQAPPTKEIKFTFGSEHGRIPRFERKISLDPNDWFKDVGSSGTQTEGGDTPQSGTVVNPVAVVEKIRGFLTLVLVFIGMYYTYRIMLG